jgi:phage terminase large subunit-like protein
MTNLHISSIASLTPEQRQAFLKSLTNEEAAALLYDWTVWARPEQLPPQSDWRTWLVLAGRGFGKTRTGAEWVRDQVENGRCKRLALVARTTADVRDVMVEGESGIMAVCPPWNRPRYEPSKRRLTWKNGAIATTYSADKPDQLRGPQHDSAWADELAAWRYPDAWDMLMFGLRLGADPRCVVTTTPRPTRIIRDLVKAVTTAITGGSTYDNIANLAPAFIEQIIRKYEGTTLGQQELYAKLLEDNPGALWQRDLIEQHRVIKAPELKRVVVALDPSATSGDEADEAGILVAGVGVDDHLYVIDDPSLRASPLGWGKAAVTAYHKYRADRIVAEVNNGGEMVELTIRTIDKSVSYKSVHASRGKQTRAEPVAALYEQGRCHHVGMFAELEDEMCQWVPGDPSPNRMDALVWAGTELMLTQRTAPSAYSGLV